MMANEHDKFNLLQEESNSVETGNTTRSNVPRMSQLVPTSTLRLLCGLSSLCVVLLILNIIVTFTKSNSECPNGANTEMASLPVCPPFPCPEKWFEFTGHCYYITNTLKSWDGAKTTCEKMNSHLIMINSLEEQEFAVEFAVQKTTWIGLSDADGEWKWVDKTPLDWNQTYWREGQPDDWTGHGKGGGEDCAQIAYDQKWNDEQCNKPYQFICEKEQRNWRK
ncbi:mannose receptor C-type 1 L homeolog [Xenopus laevis]|uniref:Mannose receptor C-type 1 L homeolog n=2 Tax=Xenopus laevis TaxID=8355 RepID=A0A8J0PYI6_XENLA|nr:mannose receptor C-type 1 L homeolog [Xenopus laevis]